MIRFKIETAKGQDIGGDYIEIYRARAPFGMCGDWSDSLLDAQSDLLEMAKHVDLSEAENEEMISLYESVNNL